MKLATVIARWTLWVSALFIAYVYFIYPVVLFICYALTQLRRDWQYLLARQDRRTRNLPESALPAVSLIIAAHNEEESLPRKLENLREIHYPKDKLEVIFVSDGSTDATNEILSSAQSTDGNIRVLIQPERGGKPAALNRAVGEAQHDILIMSDASTLFAPEAIQRLVRHFSDPVVGAACGSLRFEATSESQQTEGVYWKYETMLRLMEARMGATLTPSGAIYALRRNAFVPFAAGTLIDDLIASMNVRGMGMKVVYDPEARAIEVAAASVEGEFRRRVRIAMGSFRALGQLIHVRLTGFPLFAFVSHKLLRWLVPLFAIALLVSNMLLLRSPLYAVTFGAQLLFLAWATIGFLWRERLRRVRFALLGYFLFAMNLAFLVGFVRSFSDRKEGSWQRVH
jgi:cellulose synthase/poly-beta-1,6-N-acetylglucosamine synthase-like glycosyltransferase